MLELAKGEAAGVLAGPNAEISAEEISRALVEMRARWQPTYGLVEVAVSLRHNATSFVCFERIRARNRIAP